MQVTTSYCELPVPFQMCALPVAVPHGVTWKRRNLSQWDGGFCRPRLTSSDCCLAHVMFSLSHSVRIAGLSISSSSLSVLTATSPSSPVPRSGSWTHFLLCLMMWRRKRTVHGLKDISDGCTCDSFVPVLINAVTGQMALSGLVILLNGGSDQQPTETDHTSRTPAALFCTSWIGSAETLEHQKSGAAQTHYQFVFKGVAAVLGKRGYRKCMVRRRVASENER